MVRATNVIARTTSNFTIVYSNNPVPLDFLALSLERRSRFAMVWPLRIRLTCSILDWASCDGTSMNKHNGGVYHERCTYA